MKIGIIYACYGTPEYVNFLNPWLDLKEKYNFQIAAVHGLFKELKEIVVDEDEETLDLLLNLRYTGKLDFLYIQNDNLASPNKPRKYETEAQIRDYALQYLLSDKEITHILLLDSDEKYTIEEIENIVTYLERDKFTIWHRIEFKNLTFNEKTYTKGFRPPRIFKVKINDLNLEKIYWDNDFSYKDSKNNRIDYQMLPGRLVPLNVCNPLHYTWLSNKRSINKIKYQEEHFKDGAGCSYKWNSVENKLEWNEEYFQKTKLSKPEIYKLENEQKQ